MGESYHKYEIRDTATNKIVDNVYIPEQTKTNGWVLGMWYAVKETGTPISQIKSKDNSKVATYRGRSFGETGIDLF
jgi:hypothetical protein